MKLLATAALAASAICVGQAQAANLLTDNFNSENGGATHLQYTGFANFTVSAPGGSGVDLVGTPNPYGITCAGGSGACVDLDGTPGPATMETTNTYSFLAGDVVTLSFDLSQDQRDQNPNPFFAGFLFTSPTDIASTSTGGAFGVSPPGGGGSLTDFVANGTVSDPTFNTYTVSFTAAANGSFIAEIGTDETGNIGALLDNVSLDVIGAAPEPASWMMMLVGFFGLGAMARLAGRKGNMPSAV
jgi:hypothetical protein